MRRPQRVDGYAPIGDYAAIGDGRTVPLVALDGSIDWLCLPEFDAPPLFGAILDPESGGRFALAPETPFEAERRYLPESNVLETTFRSSEGEVRVTDAVTLRRGGGLVPWVEVARRVEGVSGSVPLAWTVEPGDRFGNGRPEFERTKGVVVGRASGLELAVLAWDAGEPVFSSGAVSGRCAVAAGDRALLALVAVDRGPIGVPGRDDVEERIEATVEHWRAWVDGHGYDGPWRDEVVRSLLALQLLVDTRSGAIAAAPTCSLPEKIGGSRNFDYRYGWVRDASFTQDAYIRVGRREAAHQSFAWLLGAVRATHPRVQPIYLLNGSVLHGDQKLDGVPGYRGSQPVVLGNGAAGQTQLGGYGDVLTTAWLYVREGNVLGDETARLLAETADFVREIWRNDDSSVWEISDAPYTYSKMACWTAFDRALRLVDEGQLPAAAAERWRAEAGKIHDWIEENGWSEERGAYVQAAGSDKLDCAALLAARMEVVDPAGDRFRATVEAIRDELGRGPLLFRYSGMQGEEGCFLACSFWLVEALARGGRVDEAAEVMDAMLSFANDVGLYSEEIDPDSHELLGNFPQGLTHLSLVNAAAMVREARGS